MPFPYCVSQCLLPWVLCLRRSCIAVFWRRRSKGLLSGSGASRARHLLKSFFLWADSPNTKGEASGQSWSRSHSSVCLCLNLCPGSPTPRPPSCPSPRSSSALLSAVGDLDAILSSSARFLRMQLSWWD